MPSTTPSPLLTWIIVVFGVVCIVSILVATKGNGLRDFWQSVKIDLLVRTICIAWITIVLVQLINLLFSSPWRGDIVLVGASLNIVMMVLASCILPGRLAKKNRV